MMENVSNFDIGSWGMTISFWDFLSIAIVLIFFIGALLGVLITYLIMDKKYIYLKDFGSYWRCNDDKKRQEIIDDIKTIEEMANKTNLRALKHCCDFLNSLLCKVRNRGEN